MTVAVFASSVKRGMSVHSDLVPRDMDREEHGHIGEVGTNRLGGRKQERAGDLRNPVRLTAAIEAAATAGHRAFLEISPHPVVVHSILETLAELGFEDDTFVGMSLRRNELELPRLLTSLAEAHCNGVFVDWSAAYRHYPPVTLPGAPEL